jgi:phosphotransferase system  glucose/maltose/N-acetylglucosamine-specific IIC component
MNTQRFTSTYYDLTHGWHGFLLFYVLIAAFSLVGLKRGRAGFNQYLYWPITSLITLVIVGLFLAALNWLLVKTHVPLLGSLQALFVARSERTPF